MAHVPHLSTQERVSTLIAIAGYSGFIGSNVNHALQHAGYITFPVPDFRHLTPNDLDSLTPPGEVILINCSGRTPKLGSEMEIDFYGDNVTSIHKLIDAYKSRLNSVLQISTSHLQGNVSQTAYSLSKQIAEDYLKKSSTEYAFTLGILQVPSIWSSINLKKESLLHTILQARRRGDSPKIQNPGATTKISTNEFLGIEVKKFLQDNELTISFDLSNSWTGTVNNLMTILDYDYESQSKIEDNLRTIYHKWLQLDANCKS